MRNIFIVSALSILSVLACPGRSDAQTFKWAEPENARLLNGKKDDFAPSWNPYEGLLYFNSTASGASQFYAYSPKEGAAPKIVRGELNESGSSRSYIVFTSENEAYLSSFKLFPDRSYLNIFKTKKIKAKWTEPYTADSLGGSFFCSQITFAPSGRFAIFSSNRASGGKDADLWMAFAQPNGSWGALITLDELNSSGSEITPFLKGEDTLFFASDGFEGPGSFDIYYSIREGSSWGRPRLAEGINTAFDESDLIVVGDTLAYFASDRPGSAGGLDIYTARRVFARETQIVAASIEGLEIQTSALSADVRSYEKPYIKPFAKTGSDSLLAIAARTGDSAVGWVRSLTVNPPKLEVSLNADAKSGVNFWRLEAITEAGELIDTVSGADLPASALLDLDEAAAKLEPASGVSLRLSAQNARGASAREEVTLDVRRSGDKGGLIEFEGGTFRARCEVYPQNATDEELSQYLASALAALENGSSRAARAIIRSADKQTALKIKKILEKLAPHLRVRTAAASGAPLVVEFEFEAR